MSYTKKATLELEKRIVDDFNIPAVVTTFHSLGYKYIKEIFKDRKNVIIDINEKEQIFLDYFKKLFEDKKKVKEVMSLFEASKINKRWVFGNFFKDNYEKYNTYDEFFKSYKEYKLFEAKNYGLRKTIDKYIDEKTKLEMPLTIKGEFVKSQAEAIIANYLYTHGIDYAYEEIFSEIMEDRNVYRPDFTIDYGSNKIIIEYFGLDSIKYNKIRDKKIKYHKDNNTNSILLDRVPLDSLELVLDRELKKHGIKYRMKTDEEIYEQILNNTPLSQVYPLKDFFYRCIDIIKGSVNREKYQEIVKEYYLSLDGEEKEEIIRQFHYINEFYVFYQDKLYGGEIYKFDYSDLLYYANKYMLNVGNNNSLKYEYIIIDEYQDISKDRYELAKNTCDRNNSKVFAVGDDWQSIYAFSGSRIDYIYDFQKYFPGAKEFKISRTYRNSQELINYSGDFIMKNASQINKQLISNKHIDNPIVFAMYDSQETPYDEYFGYQEYQKLKELIIEIHEKNKEHNILVLGRTNEIVKRMIKDKDFDNGIDTKVTFNLNNEIDIDAMTMHKSKGLTFDEVIIIGLNNHFPNKDYNMFWLEGLFKYQLLEEHIAFPEERRLFYVALTRTKNHVYLLTDKNKEYRSEFINELANIIKTNEGNINIV